MGFRRNFFPMLLCGILAVFVVPSWWHGEMAGRLGERAAQDSFRCLIQVGIGDCASLWWAGLHQENQIASILFFGGIALTIWTLIRAKDPNLDRTITDKHKSR
jgi:hypothetical protein